MTSKNMGRPVSNKYKVDDWLWGQLSNHGKGVYNRMYSSLRPANQIFFLHPLTSALPREQWNALRASIAEEAACAADGISSSCITA